VQLRWRHGAGRRFDTLEWQGERFVALSVRVTRWTHLRLHSDGGPSRAIPATRTAVPTSSVRAGSCMYSPARLVVLGAGFDRRAVTLGGRRIDRTARLLMPFSGFLQETMFRSLDAAPTGGAGYEL
jgi:hypothetical protein